MDALVSELRAALGAANVRTGATELGLYRRDASNMYGAAAVVCLPETTEQVQACVAIAHRHRVPFVARGSGTGLSGGALPRADGVLVVTSQMRDILEVAPDDERAVVQSENDTPGVCKRWRQALSPARSTTSLSATPTRRAGSQSDRRTHAG